MMSEVEIKELFKITCIVEILDLAARLISFLVLLQ